jgi:hypothetical protein
MLKAFWSEQVSQTMLRHSHVSGFSLRHFSTLPTRLGVSLPASTSARTRRIFGGRAIDVVRVVHSGEGVTVSRIF